MSPPTRHRPVCAWEQGCLVGAGHTLHSAELPAAGSRTARGPLLSGSKGQKFHQIPWGSVAPSPPGHVVGEQHSPLGSACLNFTPTVSGWKENVR